MMGKEGLRPDTLIPIAYTRWVYGCRHLEISIDDREADLECLEQRSRLLSQPV